MCRDVSDILKLCIGFDIVENIFFFYKIMTFSNMMTRLYNQLFQQIFSKGNRGTSPARGHHQPEDSYSSMNPAHLEKIKRQKRFILPVLKRWPPERLIKDKMNKYIIIIK